MTILMIVIWCFGVVSCVMLLRTLSELTHFFDEFDWSTLIPITAFDNSPVTR